MQDRKWVFTQKRRNPRVAGKTVDGVRSPVFPFLFHLPSKYHWGYEWYSQWYQRGCGNSQLMYES